MQQGVSGASAPTYIQRKFYFHSPALDGDPVLQLVAERLRRVVDDDRLGEVAAEDVEVLDVVAVDADAVLAEQPVLDVLPVGIEQVEELVGVDLLRGREQGDFVLGRHSLQKLSDVRPRANKNLVRLVLELDRERQGGVLHFLERAMDQGLIQIQDEREAGTRTGLEWQRRISQPHVGSEGRKVLDEDVGIERFPDFPVVEVATRRCVQRTRWKY